MHSLVMDVAPHVWPTGTAPVLVNLVKAGDSRYRGCMECGGEPLYRVTWATPGAWWGDDHQGRYCHACVTGRGIREGWVRPVLVVCTRMLTAGRPRVRLAEPIMRERMRLSRRGFDGWLGGGARWMRREGGGRRWLLPLVAR